MNRNVLLALAPLVIAAACAPRATRVAEETAPRLIGCSGFQTGSEQMRGNRFRVNVTVDRNGKVVAGSGTLSRGRNTLRGAPDFSQNARNLAETCTFEPATRNGVAVESHAQVAIVLPPVGV